jgi:hypothetical protein
MTETHTEHGGVIKLFVVKRKSRIKGKSYRFTYQSVVFPDYVYGKVSTNIT